MKRRILGASASVVLLVITLYASKPADFLPSVTFNGSSLAGWHPLGQADWTVRDGEIVGTPKAGGSGWLVLDKSFEDIQFFSNVLCGAGCKTGVLVRAAKTPEGGLRGYFISLADGDLNTYKVTLDAQGKELSRERFAPAAPAGGGRGGGGGAGAAGGRGAAGGAAPAGAAAPPPIDPAAAPAGPARGGGRGRGAAAALKPNDWNDFELLLASDGMRFELTDAGLPPQGAEAEVPTVMRITLNGTTLPAGLLDRNGLGTVALYAGGVGEVHFKSVSYKDLNAITEPKETLSPSFTMQHVSDFYYGWGAAAADVDRDGNMDVINGPYWYRGPDFTVRNRYRPGRMYNPSMEYAGDMITFAYDFTGDGYPDILSSNYDGGRPIDLYVNPGGQSRLWKSYRVLPVVASEIVLMKDIDGDGKPEIVYGGGGFTSWAKPDPSDPTRPWVVHNISQRGQTSNHGLGVGDINGDGRMDILIASGWFEQPAKGENPESWTFHAQNFGGGGAEMGVYDVNGDGLNDVVTSVAAHGFGLSWFEQKKVGGTITFVEHKIMGDYSTDNAGNVTFSQPHGTDFRDMDGDGIPDFIVGKRYWSHQDAFGDPDLYGPAVLYVYHTVRNPKAPGGAEFVPELVHNRSGVGSQVWVGDLNKDGTPDIVTGTVMGLFVFTEKPAAMKRPPSRAAAAPSR